MTQTVAMAETTAATELRFRRWTADWRRLAADQARFLIRFAGGATGSAEAIRVAHGRKLGLGFEITGSKGALRFE